VLCEYRTGHLRRGSVLGEHPTWRVFITQAEHPDMSRTTGCLIAACAWLAIASTARAQAPDEVEDDTPPVELVAEADELADIEQWIFAGQGAPGARKKIEEALARDLARFDQKYALTPTQKKKLALAGRHDIKRYFDRVEAAKAEYRRVKGDWNRIGNQVAALQQAQNQPHSELFGDDSMLAKTLRKTLTAEQVAQQEKNVYRSRVEWMAGFLDKRLNLNWEQHRRLVALVTEETPPLKRYGSFDYDAIMFQMSRLPREKLRSALDEAQCRELALRFDQARRMENILVSEGYLAVGRPAARRRDQEVNRTVEEARR
jgi:hypothetical protein